MRTKWIYILFSLLSMMSCMTISNFKESIEINAPAAIVFQIITDYESYDELLPTLHDQIQIVSENHEGLGVSWKSTGSFKGYKFTTTWTVIEYVKDRLVTMKDLKESIGSTTLQTESITNERTLYTMQISTKMFQPYENDFFQIYRDEMQRIKIESEKRYQASNN